MAKAAFQLKFADRDAPVAMRVSDDVSVGDVIRDVARRFKLPPCGYALRFARDGKEIELDPARSLFKQNVPAGALLHLVAASSSAGGDTEAYRETARAMIAALGKLSLKEKGGADNERRYVSLSNRRQIAGAPADLEAFRDLVGHLQERVDKTERSLRGALDELSRLLASMAEKPAEAMWPGSGGSGRNGTGGTGGGGFDDGASKEERENERRREAANHEALREILSVLQNIGRDHGEHPDVRVHVPEIDIDVVPSDVRDLLEDKRRDAQRWGSYASVCLGAIFGVVVSWATPTPISPGSVAAVGIFSVQGGLAYFWSWQAEQRIDAYNAKIKTRKKSSKKSTNKPTNRPRRPQAT